MDENFGNNPESGQPDVDSAKMQQLDDDVNRLSMDDKGKIHSNTGGTATMVAGVRNFIILGWVSAALTAFVSPYFAVLGIVFGVLANRKSRGSGTVIIITNVVLAAINILFGLFFLQIWRRTIFRG